jgi:hypothetical protein
LYCKKSQLSNVIFCFFDFETATVSIDDRSVTTTSSSTTIKMNNLSPNNHNPFRAVLEYIQSITFTVLEYIQSITFIMVIMKVVCLIVRFPFRAVAYVAKAVAVVTLELVSNIYDAVSGARGAPVVVVISNSTGISSLTSSLDGSEIDDDNDSALINIPINGVFNNTVALYHDTGTNGIFGFSTAGADAASISTLAKTEQEVSVSVAHGDASNGGVNDDQAYGSGHGDDKPPSKKPKTN